MAPAWAKIGSLPVALLTSLAACALRDPIDASSADFLKADESSHVGGCSLENASRTLEQLFKQRGASVAREGDTTSRLLKFKLPRTRITHDMGNTRFTYLVGSVFYASLTHVHARTELRLLGKPTLDGREACSNDDWPHLRCERLTAGAAWKGRAYMSGKEESAIIQAVLRDYRHACVAGTDEQRAAHVSP